MELQIINDDQGNTTGVYIPIKNWKKLKRKYKDLESLEYDEPSKQKLLRELKEAVKEIKLIEEGKLRGRSAKALLDEL